MTAKANKMNGYPLALCLSVSRSFYLVVGFRSFEFVAAARYLANGLGRRGELEPSSSQYH